MKLIPLSNGKVAKVDGTDFDKVSEHHWHVDGAGYARTNIWKNNRKESAPRMHRLIVGDVDKSLHIDHINGDKLDNRKDNLRVTTPSQNAMNRGSQSNNSSGYKGVIYDKARGKWRAEICFRGNRKHLGRFETAELAALAYNEAAIKYHGEFAYLNQVSENRINKFR